MKSRSPFCLFLLLATTWLLPVCLHAEQSPPPTDGQLHQILQDRIEKDKRGVAIVVGLIDEKGTRVVSFGNTVKGGGVPVDGKTIFEIGSITKVFTGLLLADMAAKGEVKLDDPVVRFLPKGTKVPARGGKEITLQDLCTHRSGLPSTPTNLKPRDEKNPYADYTVERLYEFLSGYELTRDIGSKFEYSNAGVDLLGHALARRAGKGYEDLVVERICRPLGLADTRVALSEHMRARLASPYDESLMLTQPWDQPEVPGAGGLRSDAEDMLKFLGAELALTKTPLADAIQQTLTVRNKTDEDLVDIGLGWHSMKRFDPPLLWWHTGGTGGYRSFIGICPARKTGVVVLANSALGVADIGFHLLDERFEIKPPLKERVAVKIKPETADRYVGKYEVIPEFVLTFTREGDRYFVQPTDQDKDEVFPETETQFFSKSFDGQIEFVREAQGKYGSLILHQGGMPDQTAKRLP